MESINQMRDRSGKFAPTGKAKQGYLINLDPDVLEWLREQPRHTVQVREMINKWYRESQGLTEKKQQAA